MGLTEVRRKIKQHIKKAGEKQIKYTQDLITTKKGWKGDSAPRNASSTVVNNSRKRTNHWLEETGYLRKHGLTTTIYKSPEGFVLYVKGRKKEHDKYKGKKYSPPSYQQILKWWNTGNAGFPHEGAKYYSGVMAPTLTPKIDKELTDNIMNTIANEYKEIKKKISRYL